MYDLDHVEVLTLVCSLLLEFLETSVETLSNISKLMISVALFEFEIFSSNELLSMRFVISFFC